MKMDWADEITAKIDLQMQATWNVAPIAEAIRKAKADGMREAAEICDRRERDLRENSQMGPVLDRPENKRAADYFKTVSEKLRAAAQHAEGK